MRKLPIALLALALAGCAPAITKIDSGEQSAGERLLVTLKGPWNQVPSGSFAPAKVWTMEGLPIDQLRIYSGIKNEQLIHAEAKGRKNFAFRSSMQPDEIVAMFEGMMTRDGSTFTLVKLEPMAFGGNKGFRFEYALTRKADSVELHGLGYGAVNNGELFALVYQAPKLAFFPRYRDQVDEMARNARLKM